MKVYRISWFESRILLALTAAFFLVACSSASDEADGEAGASGAAATGADSGADGEDSVFFAYELQQAVENTITISTDATEERTGFLKREHTCEGKDTSPPLKWEGVPAEAKSLALVLDDPESDELEGFGLWTHWVLYSIPTSVTELTVGQPTTEVLENGAVHGMNDYENVHYSGPCPAPTIMYHESTKDRTPPELAVERPYLFKLYALDQELDLAPGVTRDALLKEIDGYIIAAGELAVPYKSRRREVRPAAHGR